MARSSSAAPSGNGEDPVKKRNSKRVSDNSSSQESPRSLANTLTARKRGEREKSLAIFDWITRNIVYDMPSLKLGIYTLQEPEFTLKSRRAVCGGFAKLFEALAREAGLEARTVIGFAKGTGFSPGDSLQGNITNHVWNAVKIDGKWQLLDCTWGGGIFEGNDRYRSRYEPFYFCTDPKHLVYTHFPEDPRWQLLDVPVTPKVFINLPQVWPDFFRHRIRCVNARYGNLNARGLLTLRFATPDNVRLSAASVDPDGKKKINSTFCQRLNGESVVHFASRRLGLHTLELYARNGVNPLRYRNVESISATLVAKYSIRVLAPEVTLSPFPKTFAIFADARARLESPLSRNLTAGHIHHFRVEVPRAREVLLKAGFQRIPLNRDGSWFETQVRIERGEILLLARFGMANRYWHLLRFEGI